VTLGFRAKLFVASLAVAAAGLAIVTILLAWDLRREERAFIERRLTDQALLIAELLSQDPAGAASGRLDAEADRLAHVISGRVTLIAADGRVVGDSTLDGTALAAVENHLERPEVRMATERGLGIVERYSTTVNGDMLYAAVPARHPQVAYVRVAQPLTAVAAQMQRVGLGALLALALAAPVAIALAWLFSALLSRRVQRIAGVARRYSEGDLTRPTYDYGADEVGAVARVLDSSVQELGRRLEELSRDRARMEAILSGMVEGVLVVDRNGRLQLVNHAARVMLRVDAAAIGRPYLEVIRHPDITAQLATALRGASAESRELEMVRDPGRTFVARAASVSSSGGGGAVLVLHDISDLRRADQIRRDFVANVSHELRTPLTAIRGYVEALLDDVSDEEHTRHFLEIIARQSARMERLVKDLLRLARLDARQEVLETAACDAQQLFNAIVADLAPAIDAKRQRVSIHVAPDACVLQADPAKLHDVVRNLVENAVNYSPEEAEVRLEAARRDDGIVITVADSGPGIPPEDLTRVFERFYRVDKSRSRPGGTGLGLAIVKHLVELHGGKATAQNQPAGGAVFTVTLPAARDAAGGGRSEDRPLQREA
jgi:two-component system phosphate regulon sensor histidine kinase PhoR